MVDDTRCVDSAALRKETRTWSVSYSYAWRAKGFESDDKSQDVKGTDAWETAVANDGEGGRGRKGRLKRRRGRSRRRRKWRRRRRRR
jgi:hypothetical protein